MNDELDECVKANKRAVYLRVEDWSRQWVSRQMNKGDK